MKRTRDLAIRGYQLHLTHYDPVWVKRKKTEPRFDLDLALELVDELVLNGFNTLVVGVSDGVVYRSHPEFRKRYSAPMKHLEQLCTHARAHGLQVIPKLNFSRSAINCHNHWMRAPGEEWHVHFDDEHYWKTAFEVIDELIDVCKPARYFHVGMDEDHERSCRQFVDALRTLRTGLSRRRLRMVAWSDSSLDYDSGQVYREKSELAEKQLKPGTVRLLWNYWAVPSAEMKTIARNGHELWGAPGWNDEKQVAAFREALGAAGGTGMIMTRWIGCWPRNRKQLLGQIRKYAPYYSE
jgi:hypothetical protein